MKIRIYTLSTCPHCKSAKEFLKEHNITFKNIKLDNNEKVQQELAQKGYMGVPVIDIDGEMIMGFDEEKLKEKLNIK